MSKTKISFSLSQSEIDKALREVEQYKQSFQDKCGELLRRIAERIASEARKGFHGAIADDITEKSGGPKKASVVVKTERRGDSYIVIADGEDAVWVEFGAGVYHNGPAGSSPNPFADTADGVPHPPIAIGGFGTNGRKKMWGFKDADGILKMSRGTPAAMPMYKAVQNVSREIQSIAREVFS